MAFYWCVWSKFESESPLVWSFKKTCPICIHTFISPHTFAICTKNGVFWWQIWCLLEKSCDNQAWISWYEDVELEQPRAYMNVIDNFVMVDNTKDQKYIYLSIKITCLIEGLILSIIWYKKIPAPEYRLHIPEELPDQ